MSGLYSFPNHPVPGISAYTVYDFEHLSSIIIKMCYCYCCCCYYYYYYCYYYYYYYYY